MLLQKSKIFTLGHRIDAENRTFMNISKLCIFFASDLQEANASDLKLLIINFASYLSQNLIVLL